MPRFHVTYFYLATGMEGRADTADYGVVEAPNSTAAITKIIREHYNDYAPDTQEWIRGCLTAKEIK